MAVVTFGDVEREEAGGVADVSLRKLLRLSQLAGEYLLHVQDHLASQNSGLKVRRRRNDRDHVDAAARLLHKGKERICETATRILP